ncbi:MULTISPECIES: SE1561 family protein [Fictibacillus]|uniref:SE1561 family protein n=1 Tax=Fictibacillus terranigra TaxID=3058424 RepID=A0ABT8EBC9_9BACL|nr:SE1561 family protein [Fictibacillus sp. CENA-BCM004]MDN4075223.1 SE1561 family protein [Fictibacillus sp. CENA-BCM004]
MGKSIEDRSSQKEYIVQRVDMLLQVLDSIDAETAGVEEIDRIIGMLDDLELKCKQFRNNWEEKNR